MPQQDATCTGNYGKYYSQRLVVTIGAQDTTNNRTYVTLAAYLYCNNQYSGPYNNNATSSLTYYVDGGAVLSASVKYRTKTGGGTGTPYTSASPYQYLDANNSPVLWSGYIGHNSDGTRTFTAAVSTSLVGNNNLTGGTVSLTVTLPTIPRASTPTLSKSTFNIGETITVYTNRASASFTHSIYMLRVDGLYYDPIATGVGSSWQWNTGDLLYQQIPNKQSYSGNLLLRTFNGSTAIGDKVVNFVAKVANSNPVIGSASYVATKAELTGDDQIIIRGQSDVTVTWPQAEAQNYASISKYIVSVGSAQQTITDTVSAQLSAIFPAADGGKIEVVAVDSRGFQTAAPALTAQVVPYTPLSIATASAQRDNGVDSSTTLRYEGTMYHGSFGVQENALTACYYTYSSGQSDPVTGQTDISPEITDEGNLSFDGPIWGDEQAAGFAVGGSYTITLHLSDRLTSVKQSVTLNSGTPGMMLHRNSDGSYVLSVGKTPTAQGARGIDVDLIYPVGSIYMSTGAANPGDLFGGEWEAYAQGRVIVGVGNNGETEYTLGITGGKDIIKNTHNHYTTMSYDGEGLYSNQSSNAPRSRTKNSSNRAVTYPDEKGSGITREDSTYDETLTLDVRQPYISCYIWRRIA